MPAFISQRQHHKLGLTLLAAWFAFACGTGDRTLVVAEPDAGTETQVASGVNVCPHFEGSWISPQRIRPEEHASIIVRAVDPDRTDTLAFAWQSASGEFSSSDDAVTSFTCAQLGPEQLTVTVKDSFGCSNAMTIAVECVAN